MNALADIWNNLDWSVPAQLLLRVVPALLCITLHELSHGFTAYLLGDTTARDAGRLTLNPVRHIDPMGLLMMIVFRVGWAKPVPVNMYRFRDPKGGMALTALAGPVSNLIICVVFLFLYGVCYTPLYVTARLGDFGRTLMEMFYLTAYISLGMGLFNLLPVPPLRRTPRERVRGAHALRALRHDRADAACVERLSGKPADDGGVVAFRQAVCRGRIRIPSDGRSSLTHDAAAELSSGGRDPVQG